MEIGKYIESLQRRVESGISREHAYRSDLEGLIRSIIPDVEITNEPAIVTLCGNPDYVLTKNGIPIGFIEAKDVDKDLGSPQYEEQFSRYRKALDNLILTNYLSFEFYQNGELVHEIEIAALEGRIVKPLSENFEKFGALIADFGQFVSQTIRSAKKLAEMMAGKARLLESIIEAAVTSDEKTEDNTELRSQFKTFQSILIHDLTPQGFADIYAQTLTYGLFAARLHDTTLDTFSRQEASNLIPRSNPFLRRLFNHVAGHDIDSRIRPTVDNLAEVFRSANVSEILAGHEGLMNDPIIHFYETFLAEYDSDLRRARGVWYTPESIVKFIIRSVDSLLKSEFGIAEGLADTSKTTISVRTDKPDRRTKSGFVELEKSVHRVQILDPATGTGTFLSEVVSFIHDTCFEGLAGAWSNYVDKDLVPRLNGFELLMASYSIAHLKLDMMLSKLGYESSASNRFNIFLTNSLEEHHPDTGTLFSSWLSSESNEANRIKRDTPVMVVIGNPPYSVASTNKSDWILELINDYKKGLGEKKLNLDDDYIKFIRLAQFLIEKNGSGVVGYITNNSFIEGITHRKMREVLAGAFSSIYVLDLHGNSKKKEVSPDGAKDENVFAITQGVSIAFFVKVERRRKSGLARIYHADLYGKQAEKYNYLTKNSIDSVDWEEVDLTAPNFFYTSKYQDTVPAYEYGFSVRDMFKISNNGLKTDRDSLFLDFDEDALKDRMRILLSNDYDSEFRDRYRVVDSGSYKITSVISDKIFDANNIMQVEYRPLDSRYIYYDESLISRPAFKVMKHMVSVKNYALILPRQIPASESAGCWITKHLAGHKSFSAYNINTIFPLYVDADSMEGVDGMVINFDMAIAADIAKRIGVKFDVDSGSASKTSINHLGIFDYMYAVLNSPAYMKLNRKSLEIDFPRIPYPASANGFFALAKLGAKLRLNDLKDKPKILKDLCTFPHKGDNVISRKCTKKDWKVYDRSKSMVEIWINSTQCFREIPSAAWNYQIGGYNPLEKWIKDRLGIQLELFHINQFRLLVSTILRRQELQKGIDQEFEKMFT